MVVLRTDEERNSRFVEATALPVPFLDGIQCAFAGKIKHEQYGHCVIANKGEHVDEFSLAAEIPDRECDFRIADGDGFLHEVDTLEFFCQGLEKICDSLGSIPNVWM